jgi:hypothetical protein
MEPACILRMPGETLGPGRSASDVAVAVNVVT